MKSLPFLVGHATHADGAMAAALAAAQLEAGLKAQQQATGELVQPVLGFIYWTDLLAAQASQMLAVLKACLPGVSQWLGSVGYGVLAQEAEYVDEPALAVMLCHLPQDSVRLFSSRRSLPPEFNAQTVWVHADGGAPSLRESVRELGERLPGVGIHGGLTTSRNEALQLIAPPDEADQPVEQAVFQGAYSGAAFSREVPLQVLFAHGCKPIGPERRLTKAMGSVLFTLNEEPALDVLLRDLKVDLDRPQQALRAMRDTMLAISEQPPSQRTFAGQLAPNAHVRGLVGVDPSHHALAVAEAVPEGVKVRFCQRDQAYAKGELMRVCAQLRDALEPEELDDLSVAQRLQWQAHGEQAPESAPANTRDMLGAVYISCVSRGNGYFGGPAAELKLLRHALGDVPLVGMLAGGEIADGVVHGFSGVLMVFLSQEYALL